MEGLLWAGRDCSPLRPAPSAPAPEQPGSQAPGSIPLTRGERGHLSTNRCGPCPGAGFSLTHLAQTYLGPGGQEMSPGIQVWATFCPQTHQEGQSHPDPRGQSG